MLLSFYNPIQYAAKTVDPNAPLVLMTQIFRNYQSYFNTVAKRYRLMSFNIQGAPRPEQLANTLYGNPQLYWVLLMCNNVYDPYHGWIKPQQVVYQSVKQVHPEPGVAYHLDVKGERYYNLVESAPGSGQWFDKGDISQDHRQYNGPLAAVSHSEAAILDNERLRKIKIINPSDIEQFVSDFIKELERN